MTTVTLSEDALASIIANATASAVRDVLSGVSAAPVAPAAPVDPRVELAGLVDKLHAIENADVVLVAARAIHDWAIAHRLQHYDADVALGLRDAKSATPAAPAAAPAPAAPTYDAAVNDPVVHAVRENGRPVNAGGYFIKLDRAVDPKNKLGQWARTRRAVS